MGSHESYSMGAIIFLFSFNVGGLLSTVYFREYFIYVNCTLALEFLLVPICHCFRRGLHCLNNKTKPGVQTQISPRFKHSFVNEDVCC